MTDPTAHERATLAATDSVLVELLAELAASRPLQGPLSIRLGPPGGAHEVLDATGAVVAVWPVSEVVRRATEIASERN